MSNEILYSEEIAVSRSTKQWIISIVLLIDLIGFSLLYHYHKSGVIPNPDFDKESIIAISVIAGIFSILILLTIFLYGFSINIDKTGIHLKGKMGEKKNIYINDISQIRQISKKEAAKFYRAAKRQRRKKEKIKQYLIGTPNYLIELKNGEKILIQVKKKPSFEYALNRIMENNG
jgi:hypothetical protein